MASQTAYGVEVECEGYPFDESSMLFMDYRRMHTGDAAGPSAAQLLDEAPKDEVCFYSMGRSLNSTGLDSNSLKRNRVSTQTQHGLRLNSIGSRLELSRVSTRTQHGLGFNRRCPASCTPCRRPRRACSWRRRAWPRARRCRSRCSSDAKVANRDTKVWHGATENGP